MVEWLRQLTPTQEVVNSDPTRSSGSMNSSLKQQKAYPCTWKEGERIQYQISLRPGQQGPRQVLRQLGTYRKVGYRTQAPLLSN